jgi:hypothetical protein
MSSLNEQNAVNAHKKLVLIVAVLCALIFAGIAGGVANYTIFRVDNGQWAHLSGTQIYCQNQRSSTNTPSFQCTVFGAASRSFPVGGSYGLFINQYEVVINHSSPNGRTYTGKNIYYHNH